MTRSLRERLTELGDRRQRLERELHEVRRDTGRALLEVDRRDRELNLTTAAEILGLSRQTIYCLIEDAQS